MEEIIWNNEKNSGLKHKISEFKNSVSVVRDVQITRRRETIPFPVLTAKHRDFQCVGFRAAF